LPELLREPWGHQKLPAAFSGPARDILRDRVRRSKRPGENSFTKLPAQRIEEVVQPNEQQRTAFENLKQASAQAADELKTSCPSQTGETPLARLDAASNRLQALVQAAKTVRPALAAFYASLSDEQKARFNSMGQQNTTRSENAAGSRWKCRVP
jgi:hypothetical protein